MRFSRTVIFLLGVLFMFILFFLNRIMVYRDSKFTHGVVVLDKTRRDPPPEYGEKSVLLYYYVDMQEYVQRLTIDAGFLNTEVKVIYKEDKPYEGEIYTVSSFWISTILWLIAPVMIWLAFVFSFIEEGGRVEIRWRKKNGALKIKE